MLKTVMMLNILQKLIFFQDALMNQKLREHLFHSANVFIVTFSKSWVKVLISFQNKTTWTVVYL